LAFGFVSIEQVLVSIPKPFSPSLPHVIALMSSIYIIVRGLKNWNPSKA
jgi:hypothetical protein